MRAAAALPASAGPPSSRSARQGQPPACVAGAVCGSVRVPLFRSRPAGRKIDVGYALIHHQDPTVPAARGTVVLNPGGPGDEVVANAAEWVGRLGGLVADHDLLLIDPRGTGRSHPLNCGVSAAPTTRRGVVRAVARCRKTLGRQARAYTSAATADDFEAVREHLGIPKLDLFGMSYGTYLMTVFAQRHPSIVLSSAFPLRFDMWARANARAVRLAVRRVCARSTTGRCDGARTLRQLRRLARRLRTEPIPYRLGGEGRLLDETALAGIAYRADVNIASCP
jgi:pimeloyl-ACP methyl ester carboxylesterase